MRYATRTLPPPELARHDYAKNSDAYIDTVRGMKIASMDAASNNFMKWFGASKVIDASGAPLVVFHGTNADIDAFDQDRVGQNFHYAKRGFFFSQKADAAAEYAMEGANAHYARPGIPGIFQGDPANPGQGTANIMPVFLNLTNPLILSTRGTRSPEQWFDLKHEELYAKAEAAGADGMIIKGAKNSDFEDRTLYLCMRPEQIKSATGNSGAYDPSDPDITDRRAANARLAMEFLQRNANTEKTKKLAPHA